MRKYWVYVVLFMFFWLNNQAYAECKYGICYTWNPGVENNCGQGCTYTFENGTVYVTADGNNATISEGVLSPSYYDVIPSDIENVVINGNFETIGAHAFNGLGADISGKNGMLTLKNVGWNVFENNNLTGEILVSDSISEMGEGYLIYATLEGTLIIPEGISFSKGPLRDMKLGQNGKIYCGVDNCEKYLRDSCDSLGDTYNLKQRCIDSLKKIVEANKLQAFPSGCQEMKSTGCTKCTNTRFRLTDGKCNRIIYTIDEANQAAGDKNRVSIKYR